MCDSRSSRKRYSSRPSLPLLTHLLAAFLSGSVSFTFMCDDDPFRLGQANSTPHLSTLRSVPLGHAGLLQTHPCDNVSHRGLESFPVVVPMGTVPPLRASIGVSEFVVSSALHEPPRLQQMCTLECWLSKLQFFFLSVLVSSPAYARSFAPCLTVAKVPQSFWMSCVRQPFPFFQAGGDFLPPFFEGIAYFDRVRRGMARLFSFSPYLHHVYFT